MNILKLIIAFKPSTFGGVKNHVYHQSKEMVKKGHCVEICTSNAFNRKRSNEEKGTKYIDGIKVTYFRRIYPFALYIIPLLIFYLKENIRKFDVIHMHDFRTFPNIVAYFFARSYGIPYVLSAHGSVPRGHLPKSLKKWVFDGIIGNKMLRNASGLISLSEVEVMQYQEVVISKDKIRILPNGVDPEEIPESLEPGYFRGKYKIDDMALISFLGRIHEIKGLDFLVKSFAKYLEKNPSSVLVIAGDDYGYLNEIQKILRQLGIVEKVLLPGYLSGIDKWSLYLDSDVFVLPSKKEGFGNVIPEAAFCETVVVLSDGCAIANQVKENGFGIVVPFGDVKKLSSAFQKILSDDVLKTKMAKKGKEFVLNNWTWDKSANMLLGIYSEIIKKQKYGEHIFV